MKKMIQTVLATPKPALKDTEDMTASGAVSDQVARAMREAGATDIRGGHGVTDGRLTGHFGTVKVTLYWTDLAVCRHPNLGARRTEENLSVSEYGPCRCLKGCTCAPDELDDGECLCEYGCMCEDPALPLSDQDLAQALSAARACGVAELAACDPQLVGAAQRLGLGVSPVRSGLWTLKL